MGNAESPDITAEHLAVLAQHLQNAQSRPAKAELALRADKAGRDTLGRIVDILSETEAEQAVAAAQAEVDRHRSTAMAAIESWLDVCTREYLLQSQATAPWSVLPAVRHLDLKALLPRLREWHALAVDAIRVMEAAAARCRPVGDREAFDSFPGRSRLSAGISPLAADAVSATIEAVTKFRAALPEGDLSVDLDGLNDIIQRLIAYLHQPVLVPGVASTYWAPGRERPGVEDVNKHGQVADKLEMMARMLTPLAVYLTQLADRAEADIAKVDAASLQLIAAHRALAWEDLPATLKQLANQAPAVSSG